MSAHSAQPGKAVEPAQPAQPAQLPVVAPGNAQLGQSAPVSYTGDDPIVKKAIGEGLSLATAQAAADNPWVMDALAGLGGTVTNAIREYEKGFQPGPRFW